VSQRIGSEKQGQSKTARVCKERSKDTPGFHASRDTIATMPRPTVDAARGDNGYVNLTGDFECVDPVLRGAVPANRIVMQCETRLGQW
jgi:hypothetical protein